MSVDSLYIPAVKKTCSEEFIKYVFWKHFLGKVTRIDFVPIIQSIDCNDDLNNENKRIPQHLYDSTLSNIKFYTS